MLGWGWVLSRVEREMECAEWHLGNLDVTKLKKQAEVFGSVVELYRSSRKVYGLVGVDDVR
jgi:hypothetical protein